MNASHRSYVRIGTLHRLATFVALLSLGSTVLGQATPGAEHKRLARSAGEWDCVTQFRPAPDAPWETGKGSESSRVMAGGLWVVSEFKGNFLGAPFEGHGVAGYDQEKQKYVGTWVDSMSTSVTTQEGTYDEETRTYTFTNRMASTGTGEAMVWTSKLVVKDEDHHTYTASMPGPDGEAYEILRIEYTRKQKGDAKTSDARKKEATAAASVAGEWKLLVRYGREDADELDYTLRIRPEGDALAAVLVSPRSGEHPFKSVSWKNGSLSMRIVRDLGGNEVELIFDGKRTDAGLAGKLRAAEFDELEGSWSATRTPER